MIIDSHCHLGYLNHGPSLDEIIVNANNSNVGIMLNIATELSEFENIIKISRCYDEVYFTLGIHPHKSNEMNEYVSEKILKNLENRKFIGVGETGLDFHYNHSDKNTQIISFEKQIEIAQESSLPLVIHMRNAEVETISVIKKYIKNKNFCGVIHCFTGTQKFAEEMIDLGFYISASGVITFKKSDGLREIFKSLPLNRLLIETDSPYLSPEPLRGKINQPSHITHTLLKLSEIHGVSTKEMENITRNNFLSLFSKINYVS
tara:strand:+ start:863 stop:1645 length:783 start_codon:yes stop_codon:yes gene_type:complete